MAIELLGSCQGTNGSFFDFLRVERGDHAVARWMLVVLSWSGGQQALVTNAETSGRHSSGVSLKLRRAAAVARSSRRVRNSMRPSTILKSS
jgi:hypothetical protein